MASSEIQSKAIETSGPEPSTAGACTSLWYKSMVQINGVNLCAGQWYKSMVQAVPRHTVCIPSLGLPAIQSAWTALSAAHTHEVFVSIANN